MIKKEWRWGTPPKIFRFVIPWRFLEWLDNNYFICWADLVMWKMHGFYGWKKPSETCFEPYDYCGKYQDCINDARLKVKK